MKPIPFSIPKTRTHSFRVQVDEGPHFYDRLHYHPEWQITTIQQGEGTMFTGQGVARFQAGDVYIIGTNMPHLMKNDPVYYTSESPGTYAVSLFFLPDSFGIGFFDIPELREVRNFLGNAERGIMIEGPIKRVLADEILNCLELKGIGLFQRLLSILGKMTESEVKVYLNPENCTQKYGEKDGQRLNSVIQYSIQHMGEPISLETVASLANLSISQFCRYFKIHTRRSYIQFLNELRVETACKLLEEKDRSIAQISYEVGFNNLSNFNRQFKKVKGLTPSRFRSLLASG